MGPIPITSKAIYGLCNAMGYVAEEFLRPVTELDDIWLEWYAEEQKNKN